MTQPLNSVVLRRLAVTGTGGSDEHDRPPLLPAHAAPSTFEIMAERSTSLATGLDHVFGLLLAASCRPPSIGSWSHRAIWVEEAMHRACSMLRLTLALRTDIDTSPMMSQLRHALASELAADLRSLSSPAENQIVPCSRVLRDVVHNTTSLFAPTIGGLEVTTDVEYVWLPAYQRRALVLLASELVVNTLLHAYRDAPAVAFAEPAANEGEPRSPVGEG